MKCLLIEPEALFFFLSPKLVSQEFPLSALQGFAIFTAWLNCNPIFTTEHLKPVGVPAHAKLVLKLTSGSCMAVQFCHYKDLSFQVLTMRSRPEPQQCRLPFVLGFCVYNIICIHISCAKLSYSKALHSLKVI